MRTPCPTRAQRKEHQKYWSVVSPLEFTGEYAKMFQDCSLPTLDNSPWVQDKNPATRCQVQVYQIIFWIL